MTLSQHRCDGCLSLGEKSDSWQRCLTVTNDVQNAQWLAEGCRTKPMNHRKSSRICDVSNPVHMQSKLQVKHFF